MSNELSTIENAELIFEPKNITKETIKKYLCPGATDQELMMGLQIAKTFNLNPLKREVYFVKYGTGNMQILTGYEVYLKRAERSLKWDGMEVSSEGSAAEGNLKAIVKVFRKDWAHPLTHEAFYNEYVQMKPIYKDNKRVGEEPNTFWKNKPITMIKKVAVSQAFRLCFPDEFDGMPYTTDEVVDQERVIDVTPPAESQAAASEALQAPVAKNTEKAEQAQNPHLEMAITGEDGKALMALVKKNGRTKEDLSKFILEAFNLLKLGDIKYKHMELINQEFSKEKKC